ncbi:hypothetical protein AB0C84_40435 [Actinomadura sp. NPDC048955]|uniref:hypothetical protein n=1 Tax=Actinomadura sp. NPDC048955 TaxID=3158228 RepID=UPI0033C771EE
MKPPFVSAESALASLARIVDEFAAHPDRLVRPEWAGRRPGPRMLTRWQGRLNLLSVPELCLEGIEVAFWVTELGPLMLGPDHAACCRSDPGTAAVFEDVVIRLLTRAVATDLALRASREPTADQGGHASTDP